MDQKPPTATIESAHREHLQKLPFDDTADFDDADRATAAATIKLANKLRLLTFAAGDADSPGLAVTGDAGALPSIIAVLDRPNPGFNIITP